MIIERSITNAVYEFSYDESNPLVLHYYRELAKFEREAGFDLMINVQCSVENCIKHVAIRNRSGELQEVSRESYLRTIDTRHRGFIALAQYFAPEKLITIDNSADTSVADQIDIHTKLLTSVMSRLPRVEYETDSDSTSMSGSLSSVFEDEHVIQDLDENKLV